MEFPGPQGFVDTVCGLFACSPSDSSRQWLLRQDSHRPPLSPYSPSSLSSSHPYVLPIPIFFPCLFSCPSSLFPIFFPSLPSSYPYFLPMPISLPLIFLLPHKTRTNNVAMRSTPNTLFEDIVPLPPSRSDAFGVAAQAPTGGRTGQLISSVPSTRIQSCSLEKSSISTQDTSAQTRKECPAHAGKREACKVMFCCALEK